MDMVGQFLTMIRNAGASRHEKVDMPASNMRAGIAQILADEGYIRSFKVAKDSKQGIMRVYLKYDEKGSHAILNVKRVSTPGRRIYVKSDEIPVVRSGLGISILSTSKGVMSGKQAIDQQIGGELLCTIW
ncbi:MAG TPA: 30S ribosomal protein S8 [Pseudobdellovibrionaceae bacterium]|nr:30S ribosomal protein S8 [Pseudobdellovibrionaceae bacterium]